MMNKTKGRVWLAVLLGMSLMLAACVRPSTPTAPRNNPTANANVRMCAFRTEGNQIKDERGNTVVLHGANVPTLAEMHASTVKPNQRLQILADAGAKIVRVLVNENELLPTFVPETLAPFVQQANGLGMVVLVRLHNNPAQTVNQQADAVEDFFRMVSSYSIVNSPGLWFEALDQPINSPKQRGVQQSFVDVLRGFNHDNVLVVSQIEWMLTGVGADKNILRGTNLVYATDIERVNQFPKDKVPFIFTEWENSRYVADDATGKATIGVIAREFDPATPAGKILQAFWQRENASVNLLCG